MPPSTAVSPLSTEESHLHEEARTRSKLCINLQKRPYRAVLLIQVLMRYASRVHDRTAYVREQDKQPVERRTQLKYTGKAPLKKIAHEVQHLLVGFSQRRSSHASPLNFLGPSVSSDAHNHNFRRR